MKDWNVVVSIYQDGFKRALRALREFGPVERSPYYNVLVMKVEDSMVLLESIERRTEENPALYDAISRVALPMRGFEFQSAEQFEAKATSIMLEWSSRLAGRSFHVRLHRRAAQHGLRTQDTSGSSTTCSSPQRRRRACRAKYRSPIRMRSLRSTRLMIAPELRFGRARISRVIVCCGRAKAVSGNAGNRLVVENAISAGSWNSTFRFRRNRMNLRSTASRRLNWTVRLDAHTARCSVLDRNAGDAELANDPGIGHEVPARVGHRELGGAGRDRERQQQLIGEVKLDGGCGSVMLTHRANHLVGDCFGRPSQPAIGGKARFQGAHNRRAERCRRRDRPR